MVTPLVRGLLGSRSSDAGQHVRFAPQLPANWDRVAIRRVTTADFLLDIAWQRRPGSRHLRITGATKSPAASRRLDVTIARAFPLDARVGSVRVNGCVRSRRRPRALGDMQFVEASFDFAAATDVEFIVSEGTEVEAQVPPAAAGARSEAVRLLRARAIGDTLHLLVEGRGAAPTTCSCDRLARSTRRRRALRLWRAPAATARCASASTARPAIPRREIALPLR